MEFNIDTIRIFLHVLAFTVWVGGQIVMGGLMPVIKGMDKEDRALIPQSFMKIAWPAYGLAVFTGIWNILAVDTADATSSYHMVLGIKMLLVIVSGVAAFLHIRADKPSTKGMFAGISLISSLIALLLGLMLSH